MSSKQGGKAKPLKQPKASQKEYDEEMMNRGGESSSDLGPYFDRLSDVLEDMSAACQNLTQTVERIQRVELDQNYQWVVDQNMFEAAKRNRTVAPSSSGQPTSQTGVCYNCRRPGHIARNCALYQTGVLQVDFLFPNSNICMFAGLTFRLCNTDLANLQKKKDEEKALKELKAKASQKGSFGGAGLKKSGKK
ncbi:hypothetical protein IFM89_024397 [Coptis chinensis]|uniref:CCHC-type domain-containing protein n=2 Tax=Magnoliopsida TaxID=3398 RepID=A0A835M6G2_9MAGN|nr:hypothetical protein IFM89_024397 [Coptis chinensis]